MNSHWLQRKERKALLKPVLKKTFLCNMRILRLNQVACKPPGSAARILERKLLKNCLSVFRDWKFDSRESRELSRKNLYVPLAIGPSTCELVTNLSREKHETPNFWKNILSFFRDWSIYPPMSRQWVAKNLCMDSRLGHAIGSTCDWIARTGQHSFWIFLKTKYFPKTTKTLKKILWLINKDWACENTFKQVQSHE